MNRPIITQIVVAAAGTGTGNKGDYLYALDRIGRVWRLNNYSEWVVLEKFYPPMNDTSVSEIHPDYKVDDLTDMQRWDVAFKIAQNTPSSLRRFLKGIQEGKSLDELDVINSTNDLTF